MIEGWWCPVCEYKTAGVRIGVINAYYFQSTNFDRGGDRTEPWDSWEVSAMHAMQIFLI